MIGLGNNQPKHMHPVVLDILKKWHIDLNYNMPYYAEFNLHINFHKTKDIPTCAVNVTEKGMNFYQNFDFLSTLTEGEINFLILHEDFHLLFNHPKRTVSGKYDHRLSNIVQDMIINQTIVEEVKGNFIEIPKDKKTGQNTALFVPKEYEGKLIFEELYHWVREKKEEYDRKNPKPKDGDCDQQQQGQGQGQQGQPQPNGQNGNQPGQGKGQKQDKNDKQDGEGKTDPKDYGPFGKGDYDTHSLDSIFKNIDENNGQYFDVHMEDTVSEELKEHMVREVIERLKARGFEKGNIEKVIERLRKKRKDYLSEIKRSISNNIFGRIKTKTITRANRRGIPGLKGHKKIRTTINVLLDTSGSMSGLFEKVLAYIFQNDIEINLIQCDTEVTSYDVIKDKKELSKIKIKGLGGTVLQPGVDFVAKNLNDNSTVILTDGYCDHLNFNEIRGRVLIITTNDAVKYSGGKWVKQIFVDKTN
jgi:predicted metal-dependent peptidase